MRRAASPRKAASCANCRYRRGWRAWGSMRRPKAGGCRRGWLNRNAPPSRTASRSDLPRKWGGEERKAGGGSTQSAGKGDEELTPGSLLALAYPDRIAKSRGGGVASSLLAKGRGGAVDPSSPLAGEPFLAVAELTGAAAASRI